ncbi:putative phosphoribosyltransferase (homolog to anthranilate phosphoribosyltransferase) [Natrialba magadii ATCC 43099]|uniref:Anthranilate phosphoribosyltransferase n=1 Tax=Natrialba magadii (strain ATCC 43099 / DSM 3394 / CCM 3739 / CIP 104546 / IAM 13178 / JCM 8861 / NBRC 102185 / NCIMB 2190 / MS3) TaxID=547559 RepID=D3T0G6_NATMM|nr:anthranilate phosphoribosyltransferase [Natrialba magadii]ADD06445.1 putative phosphoribosyltransferase (homolog to anthranilate phosphoribosyltransferase) [Natrialba magadii ATCC 43099]ELY31668.1 anthranilate phosphoribosyltransferase [Natrialba magadii ATCC 43099]
MAQASQEFGEWPLKRLMTEVVGSGHKSADDMTREQAREAFQRILAGEPDETTLGAFWLANRWKRNNPEELAAYTDVMREEAVITAEPDCDPVDCGANYDGKHTSALLGVGAGVVAAAAGTPVVVHSGDGVPTQKETAYKHVLDELGVRTELAPQESADMVDETGFGFYYQPEFNPGVHDLFDRRDQMGVRTFVNTIETVANPANADVHLGSFYHLAFAKKMTDLLKESEALEFTRAIFFQGMEGYDDIRPGYTKVAEWDEGEDLADYEIETAEYGMEMEGDDLAVDDVTADSAAITEAVLAGERDDQFADAIALNGAFRMYARQDVDSLEDGLERAREVIDDGSAAAVLEDLQSF